MGARIRSSRSGSKGCSEFSNMGESSSHAKLGKKILARSKEGDI